MGTYPLPLPTSSHHASGGRMVKIRALTDSMCIYISIYSIYNVYEAKSNKLPWYSGVDARLEHQGSWVQNPRRPFYILLHPEHHSGIAIKEMQCNEFQILSKMSALPDCSIFICIVLKSNE